jgi:TetR/AcrR family acrAB operon transcriptional repressor
MLRGNCRTWLERHRLPRGASVEALTVAIVGSGIGIHQQWLLAPDRVDHEQALAALRVVLAAALHPER